MYNLWRRAACFRVAFSSRYGCNFRTSAGWCVVSFSALPEHHHHPSAAPKTKRHKPTWCLWILIAEQVDSPRRSGPLAARDAALGAGEMSHAHDVCGTRLLFRPPFWASTTRPHPTPIPILIALASRWQRTETRRHLKLPLRLSVYRHRGCAPFCPRKGRPGMAAATPKKRVSICAGALHRLCPLHRTLPPRPRWKAARSQGTTHEVARFRRRMQSVVRPSVWRSRELASVPPSVRPTGQHCEARSVDTVLPCGGQLCRADRRPRILPMCT